MEPKSNTQMPTTGIKDLVNQVPDLAMEIPEGLSPKEEEYFRIVQAMEIRNLINKFKENRKFMLNKLLAFMPMEEESAKVIMARLSEYTKDEIQNMSDEEMEKVLKVEGDEVIESMFFLPEVEIPGFNEHDFRRDVLTLFAATKQEVDDIDAIIDNVEAQYTKYVSKETDELLKSNTFDEYLMDYYKDMLANNDKLTDERRALIEVELKALEDAITIEPITGPIIDQINKGKVESIRHGFKHEMEQTISAAVKVAETNKFNFPFQLMMDLETTHFGENYKEYNNLFVFLFARFIKHNKTMDRYTVQFCNALSTACVILARNEETLNPEYVEKHTKYIKEIVDLVINAE